MRRFCLLFFLPLCLSLVLYGALFVLGFGMEEHGNKTICWITGLVKKKRAQATAMPPGTVFFVGGSATHYGLRAGLFTELTGRPAFNLGLNAGLGLPLILEEAKRALKPGDVAVLFPEFLLYHGEAVDEVFSKVSYCLGSTFPLSLPPAKIAAFLRNVGPASMLEGAELRLLGAGRDGPPPCEESAVLTPRGDVALYFSDHLIPDEFQQSLKDTETNLDLWIDGSGGDPGAHPPAKALKKFKRWCDARGVRVFAAYPNVWFDKDFSAKPAFRTFLARVEGLYKELGIPFLGDFDSAAAYPRELFLETHYHLGLTGARLRTKDFARAFCDGTRLCR